MAVTGALVVMGEQVPCFFCATEHSAWNATATRYCTLGGQFNDDYEFPSSLSWLEKYRDMQIAMCSNCANRDSMEVVKVLVEYFRTKHNDAVIEGMN